MLEYVKLILEKVSFDSLLFEKELRKAKKELQFSELYELKQWCFNKFYDSHKYILDKHFVN
jgi:hypothetical protein